MNKRMYKTIKNISNLIYKKPTIHLPEDYDKNIPSIFLCNHEKNYGPIMFATSFPYKVRPWSHSEVVHYDESFTYIRDSFCIERLKLGNKLGSILAKLIAKPVVGVVNQNNPIAIYHDGVRDIRTIRNSLFAFVNKENQLIFATNDKPIAIDGKINEKFDIYKGYQLIVKQLMRKGMTPRIYPVSINKEKSAISIGNYISPYGDCSWKEEKERIHDYIVSEIKHGYVNPGTKSNYNKTTKQQAKICI